MVELGEIVKQYRTENKLTMRDFAQRSGLSKGFISMLEQGYDSKTKKPISVCNLTYKTFLGISHGLGLPDVHSLFKLLDPGTVVQLAPVLCKDEENLLKDFRSLNDLGKKHVLETVELLINSHKYIVATPAAQTEAAEAEKEKIASAS